MLCRCPPHLQQANSRDPLVFTQLMPRGTTRSRPDTDERLGYCQAPILPPCNSTRALGYNGRTKLWLCRGYLQQGNLRDPSLFTQLRAVVYACRGSKCIYCQAPVSPVCSRKPIYHVNRASRWPCEIHRSRVRYHSAHGRPGEDWYKEFKSKAESKESPSK